MSFSALERCRQAEVCQLAGRGELAEGQRCVPWLAKVCRPGVGRREGWGADACRAAMKGGMPRPVEGGGCRLLSQREIGRAVERQKPLAHGVDKGDGLGV